MKFIVLLFSFFLPFNAFAAEPPVNWVPADKAQFGVYVPPELAFGSPPSFRMKCYLYRDFLIVEDGGEDADSGSFVVQRIRKSNFGKGSEGTCAIQDREEHWNFDGYFAGLINSHVLIDSGTSAGVRHIEVRNLKDGRTPLSTAYIPPVEIKDSRSLRIWCPDKKANLSQADCQGEVPSCYSKKPAVLISLDLNSDRIERSNQIKCFCGE